MYQAKLAMTICVLIAASAMTQDRAYGGLYTDAVLSARPTAYWRLDETSGVTAASIGTNTGRNGSFVNTDGTYTNTSAMSLGQAGPGTSNGFPGLGPSNNAVGFAASGSGQVALPASFLPNVNHPRTIEGWFNGTSSSDQDFFSYVGPNTTGRRVSVTAGPDRVAVAVEGHNFGIDGLGLGSGWHHFAVTLPSSTGTENSSQWQFVIDGVDRTTDAATIAGATATINSADTSTRRIGLNEGGLIDEVTVYHGALPVREIQHHYQAALGKEKTTVIGLESNAYTTAADNGESPATSGQFGGTDLYVRERANESNPELEVEAFLKFDLSGLDSSSITSATFLLPEINKLNSANSANMFIARVLEDWDSISDPPVFGETLIDGTDVTDEFFFGDNGNASAGPLVSIDQMVDILAYVNFWLENPDQNFGIRIRINEGFVGAAFDPDNVRLIIGQQIVPEPHTIMIAALGLLGFCLLGLRHRGQKHG